MFFRHELQQLLPWKQSYTGERLGLPRMLDADIASHNGPPGLRLCCAGYVIKGS